MLGEDSPQLSSTGMFNGPSDDEEDFKQKHEHDEEGSEDSWDEEEDTKSAPNPAFARPESRGNTGEAGLSEEAEEGMLERDVQRKTAYYDYAAEKQMSQADMKLFYQKSQLENQRARASTRGSQYSDVGSPVLPKRTLSGDQGMSGSIHSVSSGLIMAPR